MGFEKRKQYLIDRKLQHAILKLLVSIVLLVAIGFSFLLVQMNHYLSQSLLESLESIYVPAASIQDMVQLRHEIHQNDIRFMVKLFSSVFFIGLLVSFFAIRFSHKIAGPIYRLKSTITSVEQGDLSARVRIRQSDYLHDLVNGFNRMLESIENRFKKPS